MRNTNKSLLIPVLFIVSLILLILSSQQRLTFVYQLNDIIAPVRSPFFYLGSHLTKITSTIKNIPHQQRIIDDLTLKNRQLHIQNQDLKQLEEENSQLRNLLNIPLIADYKLLDVRILSISKTATLNKGSVSGIKPGQPLISGEVLVGIIDQVYDHYSSVKLFNDQNLQIEAVTSNNVTGIVKNNQSTLQLTNVLQQDTLNLDETVFTKETKLIPQNLIIGTITDLPPETSDVHKTATVKPAHLLSPQNTYFVVLSTN